MIAVAVEVQRTVHLGVYAVLIGAGPSLKANSALAACLVPAKERFVVAFVLRIVRLVLNVAAVLVLFFALIVMAGGLDASAA